MGFGHFGSAEDRDGDDLKARLTAAFEAGGWATARWSGSAEGRSDPGRLLEGMSDAVGHADVVVVHAGSNSPMSHAELALAYSHRRPIIGIRMFDEEPPAELQGMLSFYERARVVTCVDADDCIARVNEVLADPDFGETIRLSSVERSVDA